MQDKHLEPDCEEEIEPLTDDEEEDIMFYSYTGYLEDLNQDVMKEHIDMMKIHYKSLIERQRGVNLNRKRKESKLYKLIEFKQTREVKA